MEMRSVATCLNVKDVQSSCRFMIRHFGFIEEMSFKGFASLSHPQTGWKLIYHEIGLEVLPPDFKQQLAQGVILAFIVEDVEAEQTRLMNEGVAITTPLRTEPWGEKLFLIQSPDGVLIELCEMGPPLQQENIDSQDDNTVM